MKNNLEDIEMLIEFMTLVSKYGKGRIQNLIALLKDHERLENTIKIFQESIKVLDIENNSSRGTKTDTIQMDENSLLIGKIVNLVKDRKVFKSIYEIDIFIEKYINGGISAEKKNDKIRILKRHLHTLEHSMLINIYEELVNIFQGKRSVMLNEGSDLSKWSDIILKDKNSREP